MGDVFVKVENGGGVFFCKKADLSSTQGALCSVSVLFLHFMHPPLPTGLYVHLYFVSSLVALC